MWWGVNGAVSYMCCMCVVYALLTHCVLCMCGMHIGFSVLSLRCVVGHADCEFIMCGIWYNVYMCCVCYQVCGVMCVIVGYLCGVCGVGCCSDVLCTRAVVRAALPLWALFLHRPFFHRNGCSTTTSVGCEDD